MRLFVAAALAVCVSSAPALAASRATALAAPSPISPVAPSEALPEAATDAVRIGMRRETLPPGGKMAEHRQAGERYLYVVSGRLRVSNLVTGEEQLVDAGKMAAEQPGDWHVAEVVGGDPVTVYVIDRTPADAGGAATATASTTNTASTVGN
ncbi:cupin domain-containing protein [Phenylobacterium sp. LjRoot225]|uniref:cupin domain-containing protein n=1 Tax=Phenylobacterium sp. LjRoot225 TaxID=3342285 RepID=UPI003ED03107